MHVTVYVWGPTVIGGMMVVPRGKPCLVTTLCASLCLLVCLSQGAAIKRILPAIAPHTHATPLQPSQMGMSDPVKGTISTPSEKLSNNHPPPCLVESTDDVTTKPLPDSELPVPSESINTVSVDEPPGRLEKAAPEGNSNGSGSEDETEDDLTGKQDEESRSLL